MVLQSIRGVIGAPSQNELKKLSFIKTVIFEILKFVFASFFQVKLNGGKFLLLNFLIEFTHT